MAFLHGREYTLQGEEVTTTGDTSCFSPSQYLPSSLPSTFIQHIQELPTVLRRDYPTLWTVYLLCVNAVSTGRGDFTASQLTVSNSDSRMAVNISAVLVLQNQESAMILLSSADVMRNTISTTATCSSKSINFVSVCMSVIVCMCVHVCEVCAGACDECSHTIQYICEGKFVADLQLPELGDPVVHCRKQSHARVNDFLGSK